MSLYSKRGVSAQKEEVHEATRNIDKGLYPKAFCKIYKDLLGGDSEWINVMHADGAGTKSILAYLYWKETGDLSVWKNIAKDAIFMNLDDLLCVGIYDNLLFSSSIDRNKNLIPADVLKAIIEGTQECFHELSHYGIDIAFLGGETADVGDVVRTIAVNGTMAARWRKNRLVTNENIRPGLTIVGLSSYGQTRYESEYNSGIGSNGLTSARHDMLQHEYAARFPETFEPSLKEDVVYIGPHKMTDPYTLQYRGEQIEIQIGKLLLSPTRTYAPFLGHLLRNNFEAVAGLIHCSGGGQTKCLKYMPDGVKLIKDSLFDPPDIFRLIQLASGSDNKEMYQVFNMGCRMEIYTPEEAADEIIHSAQTWGLEAQRIGRVEASSKLSLEIQLPSETLIY